jgi:hypothetical protein
MLRWSSGCADGPWTVGPRRLPQYSVGFTMTGETCDAIVKVSARAWTAAYEGGGPAREGAWVAELTGLDGDAHAAWPGAPMGTQAPPAQ